MKTLSSSSTYFPVCGLLSLTVAVGLSILCSQPLSAHCEKILAVEFFSTKSHKIVYEPLLHELAARGHSVTILTPFKSAKIVPNVRDIVTIDAELFLDKMPNLFEMQEKGMMSTMSEFISFIDKLCADTYELPQVKALMMETVDLVIVQPMMNECAMGFVSHFNAPLILITAFSAPSFVTTYTGTPALHSFRPNPMTPYTDSMTFGERFVNIGVNALWSTAYGWYYTPKHEAIYREKMGRPDAPSAAQVMSNVSLILSNAHFSMTRPKVYLPDVVEVGGMHCRAAKPLPKSKPSVSNSGQDGFIFFSVGSAVQANTMPEKYRKIFVNTFSKLKQRVLWKWETEKMDDLPPNVKLGKWLPQDILGHPNIKMFITHGGLGSTVEAVYQSIPLLGIPIAFDQMLNMQQSEAAGFALTLESLELTEEKLLDRINRLLKEKSFKENVQRLSTVFRDQPDKPLDRDVFWTEYILRHKGAVHMRSAARQLNLIQYHSLDVFAAYSAIITLVLYIVFAITRFLIRRVYRLLFANVKIRPTASSQIKSKKTN